METSDLQILVALIAIGGAIIGSLITAVSNYLLGKKMESEKRIKEQQKDAYLFFLKSLQTFQNSSNPDSEFVNFQDSVNQICLYGDDTTSLCVKKYFDTIVRAAQTNTPVSGQEHSSHQTDIMNAMRKSLGLKAFESFSLVSFNPTRSH